MKTRFAPSPTGDLHLGGVWTALASASLGGERSLRIEDIDTPRVVAGSAARIERDLAWLGLRFDEGPLFQSTRTARYEEVIAGLDTYPCDCSRAEIAKVASAPHAGEEVVYPGTCRERPRDRPMKRAPAVRLRVPEGTTIGFVDLLRGPVEQRVDREVGDFVLRRGDGIFAYQLAVAVDDADFAITHVVRGDDLLASTARQILIIRALGLAVPSYAHLPLVLGPDGERLAKRTRAKTVSELREEGLRADEITGALSAAIGLERSVAEWRQEPWRVPDAWVRPRADGDERV